MTLVGSSPTVAITQTTPATGLIPGSSGAQLIGQVTVTANASGQIRVGKLVFSVGNSGFSATSGQQESLTNPYLANGNTVMTYSGCNPTGGTSGTSTTLVTCEFSANSTYNGTMGYAYDWPINAGQSQVFNLYATVGGQAATSSVASVSTSVVGGSSFLWDDASVNGTRPSDGNTTYGTAGNGTGLQGTLIYNFPTGAYTVHQ